jgi:hypothetical protein
MTEHLPNPEEKITEYRQAARRAERSASEAKDPDVRAAYFQIMRTWIYLADELEREVAFGEHNNNSEGEHSDEIFVPRPVHRPAHKSH